MKWYGRRARLLAVSVGLLAVGAVPLPERIDLAEALAAGPSQYLLPWEGGRRYLVSQTRGSTHQGAMADAVDFAIYRGERITAARAGKVIFKEEQFTACGGPELATRGNYVVIDHGDQTSALYLHLEKVLVSVGQNVEQGDPVGTSGVTGWTGCATHLHFQVQQNWGVWFSRALPIAFNDPDVRAKDPNGLVKYNEWYVSGNKVLTPAGGGTPPSATPAPAAATPTAATATGTSTPAPVPPASTPTLGVEQAAGPADPGEDHNHDHELVAQVSVRTASSLREQPTTASARLAVLFPGQPLAVIGRADGETVEAGDPAWLQVRSDDREGYVYQRLTMAFTGSATPTAPSPPATTPPPAEPAASPDTSTRSSVQVVSTLSAGEWQTVASASVRASATTESPRLAVLSDKTPVTILGIEAGESIGGESRWAKIQHEGAAAFVFLGLLETGTLAPATPTWHDAADGLTEPSADLSPPVSIRAEPTTQAPRLGLLYRRSDATLLEEVEGEAVEGGDARWVRLRTADLEGYVYAALIR